MPLIAGNKYSCEPCIRGHRATHCQHTDRLLIEVRKPGRPLERCCHRIGSCRCGRLGDASTLLVGGGVGSGSGSGSPVAVVRGSRGGEEERKRPGGKGSGVSIESVVGGTREIDEKQSEGSGKGEGEGVRVLISREQPYIRELRLSPVDEREGRERRRGKVFKRHRLGKEIEEKKATKTESPGAMDVDVTEDFDLEEEMTPALSPSLSSSESEDGNGEGYGSEMNCEVREKLGVFENESERVERVERVERRVMDVNVSVSVDGIGKVGSRARISISELLS